MLTAWITQEAIKSEGPILTQSPTLLYPPIRMIGSIGEDKARTGLLSSYRQLVPSNAASESAAKDRGLLSRMNPGTTV